jgi:ribosomal-protein-alanine N-acetyltransferase
MELNSARLAFREYQRDDFPLFYYVFSNERVMRYALMDQCQSESDIKPYFEQILSNNAMKPSDRRAYEFAVYSKELGEYLGFADVLVENKKKDGGIAHVGFFLLPDFWDQGYGTEISQTLISFCFEKLGVHRVHACCNCENSASERVMQKSGMSKEGQFRKTRYKNGQWYDELRYSILIDEWIPSV